MFNCECFKKNVKFNVKVQSILQKYRTDRPIRYGKDLNNEEPRSAKVIVVNDSFTLILAAIAGALGTAFIIIPIAIYCRRTAKR